MTLSADFPHRETVLRLAPILCVDRNEPFDPIRIGVTVFEQTALSPSFDRTVVVDPEHTALVVEYAVYWDYDIQHLYDLEHVWIYVGHDGRIRSCEVSFHGRYMVGLMRDHSNMTEDGRTKVYVQPGKHAMAAMEELFRLLPNVESCCLEEAGKDGLLEPEMFRGTFKTGPADDALSERILRTFAFQPSFEYVPAELSDDIFVSWKELRGEIPVRMNALLASYA
ncbi:hypothetical protein [Cohnella terricola]|uniref:Uncharacterized protein n=1 Tax=Cohnella terricola TaxID=1289167 RepID=A0A559J9C9_9BACL|nr:hypothetical protein [Cohnella terricola]TVX96474.1 hypothetical protein FPZ45_20955 [Cohnella terricola]